MLQDNSHHPLLLKKNSELLLVLPINKQNKIILDVFTTYSGSWEVLYKVPEVYDLLDARNSVTCHEEAIPIKQPPTTNQQETCSEILELCYHFLNFSRNPGYLLSKNQKWSHFWIPSTVLFSHSGRWGPLYFSYESQQIQLFRYRKSQHVRIWRILSISAIL